MPPKSKPTYTELKRNQSSNLLGNLGAANQIDRCYCVRTEPVHHFCVRHSEMRMAAPCERQARCSRCVPTRTREHAPVSSGRLPNGRRVSKTNKKELKKVVQAQRPQEPNQNKGYFGCQRDSRARTRTPKCYKQ